MSWPEERSGLTDPAWYTDTPDPTERELRADFAQYHYLTQSARSLHRSANYLNQTADAEKAHEFDRLAGQLVSKWTGHEQQHYRWMWTDSERAVGAWARDPNDTRAAFAEAERRRAAGDPQMPEDQWRTVQHARQLTGHATTEIAATERSQRLLEADLDVIARRAADAERMPQAGPSQDGRSAVWRTLGGPHNPVAGEPMAEANAAAVVDGVIVPVHAAPQTQTPPEPHVLVPTQHTPDILDRPDAAATARDLLHVELLSKVQELAAYHSDRTTGFADPGVDPDADRELIEELAGVDSELRNARAEAVRAGVAPEVVDRATAHGYQGVSWATEPADPRLGRITQPDQHPDLHYPGDQPRSVEPSESPRAATGIAAGFAPEQGVIAGFGGQRISDAVDTVFPDGGGGVHDPAPNPAPSRPVPGAEPGVEL
ncbi:hypothetical protein [Nocardia terpenica]|uniref:Uncharacterized protein n=1 Tax=Nocardia terpenica TaxID=455432 RepID=A0A164JIB4_9NOCA|nr:hypothetical protein [Nocardia terpenica]KZM70431.1 hypothetical protein AWN90_03890 [Nocardia terpenica]NQE91113.1 hypothetical protein [Nocardia terpenica]